MSQVFISHVKEDGPIAESLARGLEGAGLSTWYYERDGLPGISYLRQIDSTVNGCEVLVVIISNVAINSNQMTNEIVRGFESKKSIIPLRWGLSHADFQKLQPEWRGAIGAATSIQIPEDGVSGILPRLLTGLAHLGVVRETIHGPGIRESPIGGYVPGRTDRSDTAARGPDRSLRSYHIPARRRPARLLPGQAAGVYRRRSAGAAGERWAGSRRRPGPRCQRVDGQAEPVPAPPRGRTPADCRTRPQDWISITLFTDQSKTVFPFMPVEEAASDPESIVRAMNESGLLFGPSTHLAPDCGWRWGSSDPGRSPVAAPVGHTS